MFANIEAKVIAGAAGAGAGGAVSGFVLWLLGVLVWGVPADASHAVDAAAAVPGPVTALIAIVLVVFGELLGGYAAPHTARPDLTPAAEVVPAPVVEPAPEPAPAEAGPAITPDVTPDAAPDVTPDVTPDTADPTQPVAQP